MEQTGNSVTFSLVDPDGMQGFPGAVYTNATYTLLSGGTWHVTLCATATKQTPIMLTLHHYFNLEAYEESQDLLSHFAQIDSSRVIATDGILIPTGSLLNVEGSPLDFRTEKSVGLALEATKGLQYCGTSKSFAPPQIWLGDSQ